MPGVPQKAQAPPSVHRRTERRGVGTQQRPQDADLFSGMAVRVHSPNRDVLLLGLGYWPRQLPRARFEDVIPAANAPT
jgi:hypothetical protein